MKPMRIGMIAPIWETTPPKGYGGIERVVDLLVRHLRQRGHEVTLFATGDSPGVQPGDWTEPIALRHLGHDTWSAQMAEAMHLAQAFKRREAFDVFHNHVGPMGNAFAEACGARTVSTLHGPFTPQNLRTFQHYAHHAFVSISDAQRAEGPPGLRYLATIHNGIETSTYGLGPKQGYLLFLGRISPEKGTHLAIETARALDLPLLIAGKVDPFDQEYYETRIAPSIDGERVRFIGEVAGRAKREVLSGAIALLHLVQWSEPFGLVMAEALASGTPVVAMRHGSIPEIVAHGKTGFVLDRPEEAVAALRQISEIDPVVCRKEAVSRFDAARMVDQYLEAYASLVTDAPLAGSLEPH